MCKISISFWKFWVSQAGNNPAYNQQKLTRKGKEVVVMWEKKQIRLIREGQLQWGRHFAKFSQES